MVLNTLRLVSIVLTAVAMAGGFAHLFELPSKIRLPRDEYLVVQQIYRGWAILGLAVVGALASTAALAVLVRNIPLAFGLTVATVLCIALTLAIFFLFTLPANRQTRNWTMLPDNWQALRRQWEYSHATSAGLYFIALIALTLSILVGRPG